MREDATPKEGAELAFDEVGHPVGARGGRGEEGFQVLVDDPVQDRVGRGARDVGSHDAGPSGSVPWRQRYRWTFGRAYTPGAQPSGRNNRCNRALRGPVTGIDRPDPLRRGPALAGGGRARSNTSWVITSTCGRVRLADPARWGVDSHEHSPTPAGFSHEHSPTSGLRFSRAFPLA
jgi:hypothetical protein